MNLFDLHCDTPLILDRNDLEKSVDMVKHPFENYTQTMAIFLKEEPSFGFEFYQNRLNVIKKYAFENNIPINKNGDLPFSGIVLAVENSSFLSKQPDLIYKLFDDGVRMLSLTWNGDNELASGANGSGGITPKGIEVIKAMNSLGMVLDVSHLSYNAALMGARLANRVVATHSVPYSCFAHKRNIKDETLSVIKQKGGLVGLCFYPEFFGNENALYALNSQINHLLSLGMEDNISLGSDFDGALMSPELSKTAHIADLYKNFLRLGLKNTLLDKIFYKNAIAFFSKICENKLK